MIAKEEFLYVGVSPRPYYGCGYWYLDESGQAQPRGYVWVRMGRHDKEQLAYVDCVRWCTADNVPYPLERVKKVLRQATDEESERAEKTWLDIY